MAFTKQISARGTVGSYIRVVAFRMDDNARELSALFAMFVDKAHSERCKAGLDRPLIDVMAKLRVYGDSYESGFGSVARGAAASNGADLVAMIYDAAKAVSRDRKGAGREDPSAHVLSDFGGDVFADAAKA